MKRVFDVATMTAPVSEFEFRGSQEAKAATLHCTRAFRWRHIQGTAYLPQYVKDAITAAGFEAHQIGGVTYEYSVIGLAPIGANE